MPFQPPKVCTHIKVTGVRCGSPALRGEQFCYFHQRMVRGVRTPPQSRLHPIALIESEEAIQASLMEVINALARNTIDLKRAELIIRSLHIAVKNARRVKFQVQSEDMVKEVPDYPTPTAPSKPAPATVLEPVAPPFSRFVREGGDSHACKELIESGKPAAAARKSPHKSLGNVGHSEALEERKKAARV